MTPAQREKALGERMARLEAIVDSLAREVREVRADLRSFQSGAPFHPAGINAWPGDSQTITRRYHRWIAGIMIGVIIALWVSLLVLIILFL